VDHKRKGPFRTSQEQGVWSFLLSEPGHARRLLVTANAVPRSPIFITLMKGRLVPPKRRFLQEPRGVTSQKTQFLKTTEFVVSVCWSGQCNPVHSYCAYYWPITPALDDRWWWYSWYEWVAGDHRTSRAVPAHYRSVPHIYHVTWTRCSKASSQLEAGDWPPEVRRGRRRQSYIYIYI
jgi:hypothetical protein